MAICTATASTASCRRERERESGQEEKGKRERKAQGRNKRCLYSDDHLCCLQRGERRRRNMHAWMIGYGGVVGDELISSMSWSYDTFRHH
jgi:hypothetical protein